MKRWMQAQHVWRWQMRLAWEPMLKRRYKLTFEVKRMRAYER